MILPILRIGTRGSKLALWQANEVQKQLHECGVASELIIIKSQGDLDQKSPLHEMAGMGIFTKTLDIALLESRIDLAVHSLKDYPTQSHPDIQLRVTLKRENPSDVVVLNKNKKRVKDIDQIQLLGTGSVRRRAQWLNRYPTTDVVDLRGNVPTRLRKLEEQDLDGIILAKAGLVRLGLWSENMIDLDWMIPAPAQGVVGIATRVGDHVTTNSLAKIHDEKAMLRASVERLFMSSFESGCSVPIGALCEIVDEKLSLRYCINSPTDGRSERGEELISIEHRNNDVEHLVERIKRKNVGADWWQKAKDE